MLDQDIIFRLVLSLLLIRAGTAAALIRLGLMLLHKTDGLGNISRLGHIH